VFDVAPTGHVQQRHTAKGLRPLEQPRDGPTGRLLILAGPAGQRPGDVTDLLEHPSHGATPGRCCQPCLSDAGVTMAGMDETERARRDQALLTALDGAGADSIPLHVLRRMSALIGSGDVITYAGSRLTKLDDGSGKVAGEVAIFTPTLVVHATFQPSRTHDEPEPGGASAVCRVWARRTLQAVSIEGTDSSNADRQWHQTWTSGAVPPNCRVNLLYADGTTLSVPMTAGERPAVRLDAFLTDLLHDVARP
jgi:hypothetical protein